MNRQIIAVGFVAIITGAAWYLSTAEKFEPAKPVASSATEPAVQVGSIKRTEPPPSLAGMEPPLVPMPGSLDNSDKSVEAAIADFAPQLTKWLMPQDQIRKWVALVDQIADGALPREYLPLNYPMAPFKTVRDGEKLLSDASNYTRANGLIDVVTAIPPSRLAPYYRAWYPQLDEAYRELGRSGTFDKRLRSAIDRVLAVQTLSVQPALIRPSVYYKYADSQSENASDVDKLMWRLGPENTRRLQKYLRDLKRAL